MAQDWYTPEVAETTIAAPLPVRPVGYEIRPLSLGEVLDRTFSVYRSRFWLFAGITAAYALFALVLGLLNLLAKHYMIQSQGFRAGSVSSIAGAYLMLLLLLVPGAVTQAATVYALSEVYLGKGTTAVGAFRATIGRWYRYIGIAIWVGWSAAWLPLVILVPALVLLVALRDFGLAWLGGLLVFLSLCAVPYGIWAALRNSMGVQVTVIEGATVRESMKRSKVLTVGAKWRIIVIGLIVYALLMTSAALQLPMIILVARSPLQEHNIVQALSLLIGALAQTVVTPIGLIGLSLVYFDQRVRQEGFDLLMMLGPEAVPAYSPEPTYPAEPFAYPLTPPVQPKPFAPSQHAEAPLDPADPIGNDGRI